MRETENGSRVLLNFRVLLLLLLPCSSQLTGNVDSCPSNEYSWSKRSSSFQCENPLEVYHCIQDIEQNLIETCMRVFNITSYKVGCPLVHIKKKKAYLGNPFHPCEPIPRGCPGDSHKTYRTSELYVYPACIRSKNTNRSQRNEQITENHTTIAANISHGSNTSPLEWLLSGISAVVGIVVVTFILYCCFPKWRKQMEGDAEARYQHQEDVPLKSKETINQTYEKSQPGIKEKQGPCDHVLFVLDVRTSIQN